MNQDETWHAGRPLPGHIVLDGDPPLPPQRGTAPQFSAHVCCGQMAGWIKMPLGMEVGLDPSDLVLDGDPYSSPPQKGGQSPPIFGPCLQLSPNGWMDPDATCNGGRPRPRQLCVTWGPSSPRKKGTAPAQFSAHVYCGRTAGSTKTPLDTEVDLGPLC